jgi:hypothetical protein
LGLPGKKKFFAKTDPEDITARDAIELLTKNERREIDELFSCTSI